MDIKILPDADAVAREAAAIIAAEARAAVTARGRFIMAVSGGRTRGPAVFKGYWNLEKETEHTFRKGWHHTGDMGRLDADGYVYHMGRVPEQELIKPGGENVYPAEVEKAILEHPLVQETVVFGVPDEKWGEAVKAVCVLRKGGTLRISELSEFVASRIASFKKPKHIMFVLELPKRKDGSVDREQVKAKYGALLE